MLSRRFSLRESILLLVLTLLFLGIFYWYVVDRSVRADLEEARLGQLTVSGEIAETQARVTRLQKMRTELDKLLADGAEDVAYLAAYDNLPNIMVQLYEVLGETGEFNIAFGETALDAGAMVMRRPLGITYVSDSYAEARAVFQRIHDSEFRCQISDLALTAVSNGLRRGTSYAVTMTVTYFELSN